MDDFFLKKNKSYFAWRNTDKSKTVFHESIFDGIPGVPEADKEIIRNANEKPMVRLTFFLSVCFFFIQPFIRMCCLVVEIAWFVGC